MNAPHDNFGFKLPPHSREAEQFVIGGLLIDNNSIDRLGELPESAFYTLAHRLIYRAICRQAETHKQWDVLTVCEMLDSNKQLSEVGGFEYIGNIARECHSSSNISRYATIIRENAMRRELMLAASELSEIVSDKGDIAIAMDKVQARLLAITEGVKNDEPMHISAVFNEHINALEKRLDGCNKGIETGLPELDYILNGGFHRGQVIVLAARTSHGKTALSMHNAIHAAKSGYGILYLSMEMVRGELADRAIASVGRVSLGNILTGKMNETEWEGVTAAAGKLHDTSLFILDKPGLNFFQLATCARRHKRKHGLDMLVVDYLQLMSGDENEKRHAQIEAITRNMKTLAKELDIPILLLSQLSRKTETTRRPKLSDLRDSGAVEQDADVILFIHREEVDNPDTDWKNYADIYIAKNRQGSLGRIGATYIGHQVRFESFTGTPPNWDLKPQRTKGFE